METFKRTLGIGVGRVADFKTCSRQSDVYLYTYCRGAALPDAGWPGRWVAGLSCGAPRVQLQQAAGQRQARRDDTARRRATERGGRRASRRLTNLTYEGKGKRAVVCLPTGVSHGVASRLRVR